MQVANLVINHGLQTPVPISTTTNNDREPLSTTTSSKSDTVSLTASKSYITKQVITQQVDIALQIKNPVHNNHNNVNHRDDEQGHMERLIDKVVKKVHNERSQRAEQQSERNAHSAAVKSVKVKVAQSFENANMELNRLGVMDKTVAEEVVKVHSQVEAAIDKVKSQPTGQSIGQSIGQSTNQQATLPNSQSSSVAASEKLSASVETSSMNAVSTKRDLTSSMQLTTREGDVVTLNFNRSQAAVAGSAEKPEGSHVYAGSASSSMIDFSVQGELSNKESKSIMRVVERVNQLAEKLLSGNTGAAMEKLGEFKINSKQLASMSLSMSSSISYHAVSAYTQVSQISSERSVVTNESTQQSAPVQQAASAPVSSKANNNNSQAVSANSTPVAAPVRAPSKAPVQASTPERVQLSTPTPIRASVPAQTKSFEVPTQPATIAVQAVKQTAEVVEEVVAADVFDNPFDEIRNLFAQIMKIFDFDNSNAMDNHTGLVSNLFNDIVDEIESSFAGDITGDISGDVSDDEDESNMDLDVDVDVDVNVDVDIDIDTDVEVETGMVDEDNDSEDDR